VLLILAGISIATLTGDNGILTQGQNAKTQTGIGEEKEQIAIAYNGAKIEKSGESITADDLNTQFTSNGTKATASGVGTISVAFFDTNRNYIIDEEGTISEKEPTPENSTIKELNQMKYGVIEVEFLSETGYTTSTTPNAPILKDEMTAVHWNGTTEINGENDWYEYVAQTSTTESGGTSHWANAKTSDGSYYVWIPRYAYRIVYFDTEDHENQYRAGTLTEEEALAKGYIVGYSDARGIVDKDGKKPTAVSSQTGIAVNDKYFRVHPAFDGNVNEGGWSSKLTGIWVMKYEASRPDASASSTGSGTIPKSVPEVQSWRSTAVSDMFTYAKEAYNKNGELNTILNSHLMKNSEWGAVAYLTDSKYGRNGTEIAINNSSSYITGTSGGTPNASSSDATYAYNTDNGYLASSTGNIYGIYDLSGGSWEYVAGYYKDGILTHAQSFATGTSDGYSTDYIGVYPKSNFIIGDTTYETEDWNGDKGSFVSASNPMFSRGGYYDSTSGSGTFYFNYSTGYSSSYCGFRVCLAVSE